jgi:glycosyltransferase involved in cell wall biosynthesis
VEDIIFTVIITTYNRRDLLPRAIQSVLNQSFSKFELLVIDNGSTDDTRFAVQKIKDSRLQYIINPNPTASCDAPRNLGIKIARGSLISFLDDDDIWYPKKLEKVKKIFDENPAISAVCHNLNRRINGIKGTILQCGPWSDDIYERLLYEGCCLTPSAITIKTDLLRELNGFDLREEFNGAADYDLWLRMTAKGIKINFIEETLGEFSFTGNNCSIDPVFQSRVAYIIKEHIIKYEKRPIFQISRRGMWRLSQLYYITGRSFLKRRKYINAFKYYCQAILLIIINPLILLNFYSKLRQKLSLNSE